MPVKQLVLVACSFAVSGCGLFTNAAHNFVNEPIQCLNNAALTKATRSWGKDACVVYMSSHPECTNSKSFAEGFVDGYSDYLDNGGNGSSPAVPPLAYRRNKYLTQEGQQAILDYMSGFAVGTTEARASGIRNSLTVPVFAPAEAVPAPAVPSNVLPAPSESAIIAPKVKKIVVVQPETVEADAPPPKVKPITVWTGVPSH